MVVSVRPLVFALARTVKVYGDPFVRPLTTQDVAGSTWGVPAVPDATHFRAGFPTASTVYSVIRTPPSAVGGSQETIAPPRASRLPPRPRGQSQG